MAVYIIRNQITLDGLVLSPGRKFDSNNTDIARLRLAGADLVPDDGSYTGNTGLYERAQARGQGAEVPSQELLWAVGSASPMHSDRDRDRNSAIYGDVSHPYWSRSNDFPKMWPLSLDAAPAPGTTAPGTNTPLIVRGSPNTWVRMNPLKDAINFGRALHLTSLYSWQAGMLRVPMYSATANEAVRLIIFDFFLTELASKFIRLTTTPDLYTLTYSGAQNTPIYVGIESRPSGFPAASPIVGRVAWVPIGAPGLLGSDFTRVNLHPNNVHGNIYKNYVSSNYFRQTANVTAKCNTTSSVIGAEFWVQGPGGGTNRIHFLTNREFVAASPVVTDLNVSIAEYNSFGSTAPARLLGAKQEVWVRGGLSAHWQDGPTASNYNAMLRGLYYPTGALFEMVDRT